MPIRLCVTSENRTRFGDDSHIKEFEACGGTIGRSLQNDWAFPDPNRYVSGRHAMIDFQGGAYYLIDTSRNGVYVNDADAPVGRGHPQRLFDGDVLRIGDYEISVEITEDDEDAAAGLRDSVVRAQLVSEDESVELSLVDANRIVDDEPFDRFLDDRSSPHSQLSEKLPSIEDIPNRGPAGSNARDQKRAVTLFLESAGLDPQDLADRSPDEILATAGQLLGHMVGGLIALLQERAQLKANFRLSPTLVPEGRTNPLKVLPTVNDALKFLLSPRDKSSMPPIEAVRVSYEEVNEHTRAVPQALVHAFKDYMENFAPDELRQQFDQGHKLNRLLGAANKIKYWELYEDTFCELTRGENDQLPEAFGQQFARAYNEEVAAIKSARNK